VNEKHAPAPEIALDPEPPAEMLDDLAADVQTETASVRLVGELVADLVELAEDLRLVLGLMPRPLSRTST
jgi:hypothetical protein